MVIDIRKMPANACLTTKETAELLGITEACLSSRIYCKNFPRPDFISEGTGNRKRSFWKVRTVRRILEEMK